ncbi:MAG: formate--tetrahydrofolate ligase [Thermomicrobiales bacterium]
MVSKLPGGGVATALYSKAGYGALPVLIAKTHLSISHNPKLKGAPKGWMLPIREVRLAAGAGYVYAIAGDMRTMPVSARRRPPDASISMRTAASSDCSESFRITETGDAIPGVPCFFLWIPIR